MSDLVQTSPYLTLVAPGVPSGVVYAIDELTPVVPDVRPPPGGAAFGVIGLDRKVVWHDDPAALDALRSAARAPVDCSSLSESYGEGMVADLVDRGWLQHPDQLCEDYLLTTAQIEVTAHCNWGCSFCPVSVDRKPSATMPMALFEEIIEELSTHKAIRYVTFHFYNEPTLDRFFSERIAVLHRAGLPLRLYTNASQLNDGKIEALRRADVLCQLVVNLPALREQEFTDLTHSKAHARTLRNVDAAVAAGLPVQIVVNGASSGLARRVGELRERYEPRGVQVHSTLLSDRAGTLGTHDQGVRIEGPLRGCAWPVNHAHFSVRGDMFICCNDYYQREVFGNIRSGTLHEIMTSPEAVLARADTSSESPMPPPTTCAAAATIS